MRVQVDDRPRIESTSTSSAARSVAASACFFFHLSRPARAASLSGEFATTRSGAFARFLTAELFVAAARARDGATRGPSPSILRKGGGAGRACGRPRGVSPPCLLRRAVPAHRRGLWPRLPPRAPTVVRANRALY